MGNKARKLYDVWVCRRCGNGQINRRHFAYVFDVLLLYGGILFVLAFLAGMAGAVGHADVSEIAAAIPYVAWGLFLFKDGFNGHSLGKAMLGLQVVDADSGQGAGFGASFKRNLPLLIPVVPLIVAIQLNGGHAGATAGRTRASCGRSTGVAVPSEPGPAGASDQCRPLASLKTRPSFITKETRSSTPRSARGSPETATMSA
jgi:uncharacterized RDD family membrane protein YckC